LAFANKEKTVIDQMHKQGIIQKSNSPWFSPLLLIFKKNGKIRHCVDYRALNSKTLKDAYPIKSVQENIDAMAGAALFSTFDLTSGYHEIPVSPLDIPKLPFLQNMFFTNFVQCHLESVTVQPHAKD
jgi:hypothetical protein